MMTRPDTLRSEDAPEYVAAPSPTLADARAVIADSALHSAVCALLHTYIIERDVMTSFDAVINYLRAKQGYDHIERMSCLFLDKQNHLIADETLWSGTVDQVALYTREIIKRALTLNASALILAHNHPSGV